MKFIVILSVLIGGIMAYFGLNNPNMPTKTEEERRNREYEVSLVKALKNPYEGIEEIVITEPKYTEIPGDWSCAVELTFSDGCKVNYTLPHSLSDEINRSAIGEKDSLDELNSHFGKTTKIIKVQYSNGEAGVK